MSGSEDSPAKMSPWREWGREQGLKGRALDSFMSLLTYLQKANPRFPGRSETIRGYRGGYLPNERREIERGLREGKIRGVVSTSALELGIDVGSLDATVMAGYPGTIAATWQRAGRAGRRNGSSCAVMVASCRPRR